MKERGIIFSKPMVLALLAGTKTQTRRIVRGEVFEREDGPLPARACPYGKPGDRLWVRETFADTIGMGFEDRYHFKANASAEGLKIAEDYGVRWKPSIHMPREAARILLEVTDTRVEKLQDISESDAQAEGVQKHPNPQFVYPYAQGFACLWDSIHAFPGVNPWALNPWVWVISFKRVLS